MVRHRVSLTGSVWADRASVRTLHARAARVKAMDLVAVALALAAFIALYGLIELVDRI
jgi:hypothetical protein